eukprot:TRINITY_DN2191_c0_g3_i3.p1 TRINITY_DN2191_c0_g3~~TRINITY_DN2191_c0_g3_i3.p1  ORF type:complete len:471 (+),score=64.81 TRINITY_DN2191_c0_g3_i3:960-2372(+)
MTVFCPGLMVFDVVFHELAHAYTNYIDQPIYEYYPGALNEAFSDSFAEASQILSGLYDLPLRTTSECSDGASARWIVGDETSAFNLVNADGWQGPGIRDMYNPHCYAQPEKASQTRCSPKDNDGVHANSGVASHLFALTVDGGTFNGVSRSGIGAIKALHIWMDSKRTCQGPTTTFAQFGSCLEVSCAGLIGKSLNDQNGNVYASTISASDCDILQAWINAVGLEDAVCTTDVFYGGVPPYQPTTGGRLLLLTGGLDQSSVYVKYGASGSSVLVNPFVVDGRMSGTAWNQVSSWTAPSGSSGTVTPYELYYDSSLSNKVPHDTSGFLRFNITYFTPPTAHSITPSHGALDVSTTVTITGSDFHNFQGPCTNYFKSWDCLVYQIVKGIIITFGPCTYQSSDEITCVLPAPASVGFVAGDVMTVGISNNGMQLATSVSFLVDDSNSPDQSGGALATGTTTALVALFAFWAAL